MIEHVDANVKMKTTRTR